MVTDSDPVFGERAIYLVDGESMCNNYHGLGKGHKLEQSFQLLVQLHCFLAICQQAQLV